MIIKKQIGITSYGSVIPQSKIMTEEIERAQNKTGMGIGRALGVESKTVPAIDEDTITLSVEAGRVALERWLEGEKDQKSLDKKIAQINNLFIGSESHPYAVKPSGTVVKQALGLSEEMSLADLQFACKAGTAGMQIGFSYLASGWSQASLAIGADTAQAEPGDALEFTAGAGAAAYILGKESKAQPQLLARLVATLSVATDTPDFWRRAGESYPQHAGRFSGEPAYFYHVVTAAQKIMDEVKLTPKDFDYCIFHTPNAKFPKITAKKLGFSMDQLAPSLVVQKIGNTYAGAVPLALSAVLDQAQAGQKILVVSYGSGAGSDAFIFETTDLLVNKRKDWTFFLQDQIKSLQTVSYQDYRQVMELLTH